ncbi:MAG: response regulator [Sedimentisphaerales bacterium]|jgi:DNA-binding response OmpR family regulator
MTVPSVLIIDDDPDFVDITRQILETKEYDVRLAYNPEEGWTKLKEDVPDILILDVMMGRGAEGFLMARKIRQDPHFSEMPILMLTSMREQTGFDFPGEPIHSKFLPVDDYVEKGIEPSVLFDKIEQQLAKKESKE